MAFLGQEPCWSLFICSAESLTRWFPRACSEPTIAPATETSNSLEAESAAGPAVLKRLRIEAPMVTLTSISELHAPPAAEPDLQSIARGSGKDGTLSLLDILIILAGQKRLILRATLACALLSTIVSFLLPVRYTAKATILPPRQNSSLDAMMASNLGGESSQLGGLGGIAALADAGLGLGNPHDRYVGMLKSRIVEDAVIKRVGLMGEYHKTYLSDTRKKLEDRTDINGDGKDKLIHISAEDPNPRRAVDIVDAYVDQFRDLSRRLAINEASQRRLFFEQQLVQAKDNLASADEALKQTQETTGLIELNSQAEALIGAAATLRAQIAAHEMMIQGMQTYATGQNAQLIEAQQELGSLRAQLAKLGGSEESADGLIVPKGLVPQAGLEYVRKVRDVKYYEAIFTILARQYELAKLDEAKAGAITQVVDPAIIPDKRSSPKRSLIIIGATAIGFFIGAFLALVRAGLLRMKADAETNSKLALLKKLLTSRTSARGSITKPGGHLESTD